MSRTREQLHRFEAKRARRRRRIKARPVLTPAQIESRSEHDGIRAAFAEAQLRRLAKPLLDLQRERDKAYTKERAERHLRQASYRRVKPVLRERKGRPGVFYYDWSRPKTTIRDVGHRVAGALRKAA